MKNIEEIVDEYDAYQRDHADETKEDIVNHLISEIDRNYEKLFLYTGYTFLFFNLLLSG